MDDGDVTMLQHATWIHTEIGFNLMSLSRKDLCTWEVTTAYTLLEFVLTNAWWYCNNLVIGYFKSDNQYIQTIMFTHSIDWLLAMLKSMFGHNRIMRFIID
jgi:hypothetical protein